MGIRGYQTFSLADGGCNTLEKRGPKGPKLKTNFNFFPQQQHTNKNNDKYNNKDNDKNTTMSNILFFKCEGYPKSYTSF